MSRQLFHSTLEEKKAMLKRLEEAYASSPHEDVATAILVVKDSILLHEAHKTFRDIDVVLTNHQGYHATAIGNITWSVGQFYERVNRAKRTP